MAFCRSSAHGFLMVLFLLTSSHSQFQIMWVSFILIFLGDHGTVFVDWSILFFLLLLDNSGIKLLGNIHLFILLGRFFFSFLFSPLRQSISAMRLHFKGRHLKIFEIFYCKNFSSNFVYVVKCIISNSSKCYLIHFIGSF